MHSYFVGLFILPLLMTVTCFGQAKELTSEDYFSVYSIAIGTLSERPRMRRQKTEYFEAGKLVRTIEEIEEVQDKNRRRITIVETVGNRRAQEEIVRVNKDYYCRSGLGSWKKSSTNCSSRGARITDGDEGESHYTAEQVTLDSAPVTLLRHYVVYTPAATVTAGSARIWENRVWLDRNYLILRREHKSGIPSSTYTTLTETYDYDKNPNIVPPIE